MTMDVLPFGAMKKDSRFIFDIHGVLTDAIWARNWQEIVQRILQKGNQVIFATNSAAMRREELYVHMPFLVGAFSSGQAHFASTGIAAANWVAQHEYDRIALLGSESLKQRILEMPHVRSVFQVAEDCDVDALIIARDRSSTLEAMEKACKIIERGIPCAFTSEDIRVPHHDTWQLGPGILHQFVHSILQVKNCITLGKPQSNYAFYNRLHITSDDLIVGDSDSDLAWAQNHNAIFLHPSSIGLIYDKFDLL